MRILQICTNFRPGGIQRHVLDMTADLRARGHQMILAGDAGDWAGQAQSGEFIALSLNDVAGVAGGGAAKRLLSLWREASRLRHALRDHPVDLIHAHETAPALIARAATFGRRIPIVMTYHGAAPSREASVARIGRRCADLVISPSATSLKALIAKGLPEARTMVIGLGIVKAPEQDKHAVTSLRASLLKGLPGPLIISLSRLSDQKGIDIMIDVAGRVVTEHPGAVFAVAGGGPLVGVVQGWAEKAGVAANMRFLGPISTVPLHLQASDMFLLTSRWENLPISIVEAFRAGLPVIATDCGGVRELVDDTVGALLPVGDAQGISRAVIDLIEDKGTRSRKADAARHLSQDARFDPTTVHARFEQTYQSLIARHQF
jgi:glycosyltransferase involved in cell wall biosynthesis